jgi:hypothetical protein
LNMALIIYAGRIIAFGHRHHVFEQVARSAGRHQVPAASASAHEGPAATARKDESMPQRTPHHATV